MKFIKLCILTLFITSILFSCNTKKELAKERKEWNFKNWDKAFKERAFCLCQLKGFENQYLENNLMKNDKSYYSALGIAIFDTIIIPQIKKETKLIRLDSINAIGTFPEDLKSQLQKRSVMNHCIEFYNSRRLDSLANSQKKYWKNTPNIMDEIHLKIPTY